MPFITYVPFIAISAAFGGLAPGLLATFLCTLESCYFAVQPVGSFRVTAPQDWLGIGLLALCGVILAISFEKLKRAARTLAAANRELLAVHENAPVALLVVDEDLRVQKANDRMAQLTGRTVDAIRGLRPGAAIGCLSALDDPKGCGYGPSCGQCPIRLAVLDSERNGTVHEGVEAWLPLSSGGRNELRCLEVSTAPFNLDRAKRVLVCAQDITPRKQAEIELHRQAELINLAHDAIITTDAARTIRTWNKGAAEVYGWTEAEALGKAIHHLLGTGPATPAAIDEALARDGRWEGRLVHTHRDGRQIVIESRQALVRDAAGAPTGILEINRDVTERERVQEELKEVHRKTAAILKSISDGFVTFDQEWCCASVNAAAAKMLARSPEQLAGKHLREFWPHATDSPFGAACRRAVAENVPVQVEVFYPSPLSAWFDVRCYPSPHGLGLFFANTTERKRAESALRDTVRDLEAALSERTVLLKEVHHRVKNNLAVISSLLGMSADATANPEARRALEESQQRVHSIARIHEHLYGNDHLDRVNFSEYARELVDELRATFDDGLRRIAVEVSADPVELGIHRAVPCALILNELVSNAFKYAFPDGRHGRLSIVCRESAPGEVKLVIDDDGVGLPQDFDWRRTGSLGFEIVQILAKQIDATVDVIAGHGTRFELTFPRGHTASHPVERHAPQAAAG